MKPKPCFNCQAELVEEARFCWRCGEPQSFDLDHPGTDMAGGWELAEIAWDVTRPGLLARSRRCFWARAVGHDGTYVAGESEEFTAHNVMTVPDPALRPALDRLLSSLQRDGWEPLASHGEYWYSYRFRRPVWNHQPPIESSRGTAIEMDGLCADVSTTRTPSGEWVALGSVTTAPAPMLHPAWLIVGTGASADLAIDNLRAEMRQREDQLRSRIDVRDEWLAQQVIAL